MFNPIPPFTDRSPTIQPAVGDRLTGFLGNAGSVIGSNWWDLYHIRGPPGPSSKAPTQQNCFRGSDVGVLTTPKHFRFPIALTK